MTSTVPAALRVLIQHSSPLIHLGLHTILAAEASLELMASEDAGPPRHPNLAPPCVAPDIIVTDYADAMENWLPRRSAARHARSSRLMVVTGIDRERQIHQALALGVEGYVAETAPLAEVRHGLLQIARGKRFVSSCFSHMLVNGLTQPELTLREQAVLTLIALGRPNKTIARDLEIAAGTVKSHVRSILAKLDVTTRTEAAHVAQQRGLVQVNSVDPAMAFVQYRDMSAPWRTARAPEGAY